MVTKAPRRTAERILETTLDLFNRFGAPHVSTTLIASTLRISPGNLYYHFPAKDTLIEALFDRYAAALTPLLDAAEDVANVEDAWFFMHALFELVWQYRFLYRNVGDLLAQSRRLEAQVQAALEHKARAMHALLAGLERSGVLQISAEEAQTTSTTMVVVLTWWLSYEYAHNPRRALEPEGAQAAMLRGARHVLGLLMPYLATAERSHLHTLASVYAATG